MTCIIYPSGRPDAQPPSSPTPQPTRRARNAKHNGLTHIPTQTACAGYTERKTARAGKTALAAQPAHRAFIPLRSLRPSASLPRELPGHSHPPVKPMKPAGSPPPIGRSPPVRGRGRASGRAVLRAAQRPAGTPKTTGRAVLAGSQRATSISRPRSRASSAARGASADSSGTRP